MKRQYELYKDKGFEVISISIDKTNVAKTYSVRSIPSMFLIDTATMDIIARGTDARGEQLAKKLAELF